jgi:hypothetical protein
MMQMNLNLLAVSEGIPFSRLENSRAGKFKVDRVDIEG